MVWNYAPDTATLDRYRESVIGVVAMPKKQTHTGQAEAVTAETVAVSEALATPVRVPDRYTGTSVEGLADWAVARRKQAKRDLARRLVNGS